MQGNAYKYRMINIIHVKYAYSLHGVQYLVYCVLRFIFNSDDDDVKNSVNHQIYNS